MEGVWNRDVAAQANRDECGHAASVNKVLSLIYIKLLEKTFHCVNCMYVYFSSACLSNTCRVVSSAYHNIRVLDRFTLQLRWHSNDCDVARAHTPLT